MWKEKVLFYLATLCTLKNLRNHRFTWFKGRTVLQHSFCSLESLQKIGILLPFYSHETQRIVLLWKAFRFKKFSRIYLREWIRKLALALNLFNVRSKITSQRRLAKKCAVAKKFHSAKTEKYHSWRHNFVNVLNFCSDSPLEK